ncbi:hypothetical protein LCGC14_2565980, partial [marine sediment metagenome]
SRAKLAKLFNTAPARGGVVRMRLTAPWKRFQHFADPQPVPDHLDLSKVLGHYHTVQIFVEAEEEEKEDKLKEAAVICEEAFAKIDIDALLDPATFIGRAPQQVDEFLAAEVEPIRKKYADKLGEISDLKI